MMFEGNGVFHCTKATTIRHVNVNDIFCLDLNSLGG